MNKDLFIKFFRGKCSEKEFDQLIPWIKNDALTDTGRKMVQEVWDGFEPETGPVEKVKYNRILDRIHHTININDSAARLTVKKNSVQHRIGSAVTKAAAVLLIPVLSLWLYTFFSEKGRFAANMSDLEVEAPAFSCITINLGDGTRVWLNHGSHLKYPYRFKGKSRKVFLTGEAYFEVAHNKEIPFVVGTGQLDVVATGTAFNVSAYPDDEVIATALVEGKVILREPDSDHKIRELSPNECLKFNPRKNNYVLESSNIEKYTSWKDGKLLFKNDPVEEIARKLGRWYNVEVEITDKRVRNYTCTATFTDETLAQVLELLSMPTPVNYKLCPRETPADGSIPKQKVLIGLKKSK